MKKSNERNCVLSRLTKKELQEVKPISRRQIEQALKKGRAQRLKVEALVRRAPIDSRIRFR